VAPDNPSAQNAAGRTAVTPVLFGLLVGLASALGAALATPSEAREAVVIFVMVNMLFATTAYAVGGGILELVRGHSQGRRRP